MLAGKDGAARFRSKYGIGHWFDPRVNIVGGGGGIVSGQQFTLEMPKNLAVDLGQRRAKGLVPALGLRIRGTVTPDAVGGATPLFMSKLQFASFFDVNIVNSLQNPYSQKMLDLAKWQLFAMAVNPDAEMLDQEFPTVPGMVSKGEVSFADFGVDPFAGVAHGGGAVLGPVDQASYGTKNAANYPCTSRLDSYWRQLEGMIQVRDVAGAVNYFDLVYSIPLCAGTGRLRADVIPLETLCDVNRPWQVEVKLNTDFAGKVIGFDGGSITVTRIELHVYIIPIREEESRECGNTYIIRNLTRAASPFLYQNDEVVLLSANLPDTQSTTVDNVDMRSYQRRIKFGDYSQSLIAGAFQDLYSDGEVYFPPYAKDRNPRFVIEGLWNCNPRHHIIRTAYDRSGNPIPVVRGGRNQLATIGFQNVVDPTLVNILGEISPWPIQVLAATNLNMSGFPGFGTLTANCKAPYIMFEGWLPSSNTWDVVLNTTEVDVQYIQSLGGACCDAEKPRFAPTIDGSSPKAGIILSSGITTYEEVKKSDPNAVNVPPADPKMSSVGQNPAGKAAQ
jgi:hypothetical protein